MKYGSCTRCFLDWKPKRIWNSKNKIWQNGCQECGSISFWTGGKNAS